MKKTVLYPLTVIEVDLEGGSLTRLDLMASNVRGNTYAETVSLFGNGSPGLDTAFAPIGSRFRITIEALDVSARLEGEP